jgi:c(7)-type cytochrome triheme protein
VPYRNRSLAVRILPSAFVLLFTAAPRTGSTATKEVALHLPETIGFTGNPDSPGAVFFRHSTHAALVQNRCLSCHPRTFRILKREYKPAHEALNAGKGCGSCHDGKQAFGTADDKACELCHTGSEPVNPMVRAIAMPRGPDSPAPVTFSHQIHVAAQGRCTACHPSPFAMTISVKPRTAGAMHNKRACGACHNGESASSVDDACDGCHREEAKR